MIERYAHPLIAHYFSDEIKTWLWQQVELAVLLARKKNGEINLNTYRRIRRKVIKNPIDLDWWKQRDNAIHHDYNAFCEERRRFLDVKDQAEWHKSMTSYDGEEPATSMILDMATTFVLGELNFLINLLEEKAKLYRYTIMMSNTHGQNAELQSFGKRILTWISELKLAREYINSKAKRLKYSKISGAVGNYTSIDPKIEKVALKILGLKPFYGATQIMPRIIQAELAQSLSNLVSVLDKIALDIRLGARSDLPIYQEPFAKIQKGSSAMPHKKNTIRTEQIMGMNRLATGNMQALTGNIVTWEERAIEQSCVERVAFPDLFHIVVHSIGVMYKVISELKVYPDNMLLGIYNTRGCYATNEAKEKLAEFGIPAEDAYRIVQLAAFNVFEPSEKMKNIRDTIPNDLFQSKELLYEFMPKNNQLTIFDLISEGKLRYSDQLEHSQEKIDGWNALLISIFGTSTKIAYSQFEEIFKPSYLLRNEHILFEEILNCK